VLTLVGIFILPLPAFLVLGVWFALQLWEGDFAVTHPSQGGGVAFFAHIGGFLFGAATVYLVAKQPPLRRYR
jgi:membrane associated rhomboid family serine protease